MSKYLTFISRILQLVCILALNNCSSSINFSPTELPQAIVDTPYSACIYVTHARIENFKDIQISTIPENENIHILSLQEKKIHLRYNEDLNHSLQIQNYPDPSGNISSENRNQNYNEIWLYGIPKHTGKITLILHGTTNKPHKHFEKKYILIIINY